MDLLAQKRFICLNCQFVTEMCLMLLTVDLGIKNSCASGWCPSVKFPHLQNLYRIFEDIGSRP